MNVRTRLALATALALLTLLLTFYIGGRVILRNTFHMIETKIEGNAPSLDRAMQDELRQLDRVAQGAVEGRMIENALRQRPVDLADCGFSTAWMRRANVRLVALADATGAVVSAVCQLPGSKSARNPVADLAARLQSGGGVGHAANPHYALRSGVVVLDEVPMLLAVQRVPADPSLPQSGVLVVGTELFGEEVSRRFGSEWSGVGDKGIFLTEVGTSLAWLSLFVALVGIFFITPLLVMQGHAVLNPLSRLAGEIQSLQWREPAGRRLEWPGKDEFAVVARAVNSMLEAIEQEHRKIEESESRGRALLAANPDLLFLFDRDGRLLDMRCPPGAEQFLAVPPGQAVGRSLYEVRGLPAEWQEKLRERIRAAFETQTVQWLEFHVTRGDGQDYWGESRIVMVDANRALIIERNVSERNRAERARRLLEVRIGQKQKMESLGILASGIAHDFNNILAAVLAHAEDAASRLPADSPAVETLGRIRSSVIRASGLTRQLQAYAGQGSMDSSSVDLNSLLVDMSQLMRTSLSKKAVFEMNLGAGLPPIQGDPSQLWQVAMNLLLNASEALDGKPGSITIATRKFDATPADLTEFLCAKPLPAGLYVLLEVRDTGHGMAPETLARIFDPFFSTKGKGRGLGLSAVVGIVQTHGGGIAVRSVAGEGTTFRIVLPSLLVQSPAEAAADVAGGKDAPVGVAGDKVVPSASVVAASPAGAVPETAKTAATRVILLAEDEADIRKVMVITLRAAGFEVLAAENGREAVEMFAERAREIHVVLLDQEMPVMNGEEAFRAIRALREDTPIVVMTGYGETSAMRHFGHLMPNGVLGKPFTRDRLMETIERACQGARAG